MQNLNDIYIYDVKSYDFIFQKLCRLPDMRNFRLKFCHNDSKILTLFDEYRILHLNITNGDSLYSTNIGNSIISDITVTPNYRICDIATASSGSFEITNIYTEIGGTLCLSNRNDLVAVHINDKTSELYILYNNGTVMFFSGDSLALFDCYNYCPGRHVISAYYDKKNNLLCFSSSPYHSYMYSLENTVTLVNLTTKQSLVSTETFSSINKLLITEDGNNILGFTDHDILLLDTSSLTTKDTTTPFNREFEKPVEVFSDNGMIHAIYSHNKDYGGIHYYGTICTYKIYNCEKITKIKDTYLPYLELKNNLQSLWIKQIPGSSLCIIKAQEDDDTSIFMEYLSVDSNLENEIVGQTILHPNHPRVPLNEWNLVYLDEHKSNDADRLSCRNQDLIIHDVCVDFSKNVLYTKDNILTEYIFENKENISINIDLGKYDKIVAYSPILKAIYTFDEESQIIHKYKTIEQYTKISSVYLHPYALVYNCDFAGCNGELSSIPKYK